MFSDFEYNDAFLEIISSLQKSCKSNNVRLPYVQIHQWLTFRSKCFIIHFVNECLCVYIYQYTYRHIIFMDSFESYIEYIITV